MVVELLTLVVVVGEEDLLYQVEGEVVALLWQVVVEEELMWSGTDSCYRSSLDMSGSQDCVSCTLLSVLHPWT